MDAHVIAELSRAVAWFAMGFAAAVVLCPFAIGLWPDGDGGD